MEEPHQPTTTFPSLPTELRLMIWEFAAYPRLGRTIPLLSQKTLQTQTLHTEDSVPFEKNQVVFTYRALTTPHPIIYYVNYEAREVAMKELTPLFLPSRSVSRAGYDLPFILADLSKDLVIFVRSGNQKTRLSNGLGNYYDVLNPEQRQKQRCVAFGYPDTQCPTSNRGWRREDIMDLYLFFDSLEMVMLFPQRNYMCDTSSGREPLRFVVAERVGEREDFRDVWDEERLEILAYEQKWRARFVKEDTELVTGPFIEVEFLQYGRKETMSWNYETGKYDIKKLEDSAERRQQARTCVKRVGRFYAEIAHKN